MGYLTPLSTTLGISGQKIAMLDQVNESSCCCLGKNEGCSEGILA